ncbi:EamA/RhaT family transporter [Chitinimonas sp. PSY-7]|uniref:EamA/RhaT family transporter n=1 Tax=Chitinimonas sp. PSY-7 TaxID=3459088 RepID=UPI0040402215
MYYLLFSIVCSIAVSVSFKLARRYPVDLRQAILVNYGVAATLCVVLLRPDLTVFEQAAVPWPHLLALGALLPAVFIAMVAAVREAGMVRSDAAQRLSLIIPLVAAFTVFGEVLLPQKLAGVLLGFAALGCLLHKPAVGTEPTQSPFAWRYLLAIWLGYGLVDLLFKRLALAGTGFTNALLIALLLSGVLLLAYLLVRRVSWQWRALLLGLPLGLLNFGNILFYIRAHQQFAQSPALVFASTNIGVIALGTLVGGLVFKEAIRPVHWLGLGLAIGAVLSLLP